MRSGIHTTTFKKLTVIQSIEDITSNKNGKCRYPQFVIYELICFCRNTKRLFREKLGWIESGISWYPLLQCLIADILLKFKGRSSLSIHIHTNQGLIAEISIPLVIIGMYRKTCSHYWYNSGRLVSAIDTTVASLFLLSEDWLSAISYLQRASYG